MRFSRQHIGFIATGFWLLAAGIWMLDFDFSKDVNISLAKAVVSPKMEVSKNELRLNAVKGVYEFNGEPFTGISTLHSASGALVERSEYLDGKRHGFYQKFFAPGGSSFEAHFENGLRTGVAKSWWRNGNLRSEYSYLKGTLHGLQKDWYKTGEEYRERNMTEGKELGMQKAWRKNGKLYNNYEAKDGRIFGLRTTKMCYDLDDENVVLVNE